MCACLFYSYTPINIFVTTCQAIVILADFSHFHPEELDQMLTNLPTSSSWAAIKKAVNELNLKKMFLQLQDDSSTLEKEIIQIALNNRLVSGQALSESSFVILFTGSKHLTKEQSADPISSMCMISWCMG